ncbi:MAG: hypothetical protein KDD43_15500 [Bdellovibrionales bacterium]|nr:hypothetical protein [Bdellovibrionales bacterium]
MHYTEELLRLHLGSCDVPLEKWGTGKAKTLNHFLVELIEAESTLNGVVRRIDTVAIDVISGGRRLREACQVCEWVAGECQIFQRTYDFGSVVEKLKVGERLLHGVERAIKEELGLVMETDYMISPVCVQVFSGPSDTYPGIFTINTKRCVRLWLPKRAYRPNGYFENSPGRTIYFDWIPIQS